MIFPPECGFPTISGYGYSPDTSFIRTEMDTGEARQRQRFTAVSSKASFRFVMSQQQFRIFEDWYNGDGKNGSAWFDLAIESGNPATRSVRFVQPYSATSNGVQWIVSVDVEVRHG